MSRTLVVTTRVGVAFPKRKPPTEEKLRWRLQLLRNVGCEAMARVTVPHVWVWRTHGSTVRFVERYAPPGVLVVDQEATEDARVAGERFLVARVDSDDAFLPAALDALNLDEAPGTLVDWPDGWQLDLESGRACEMSFRGHWQSPFLAVTQEERGRMLDVGGQHTLARRGRRVVTIPGGSWLQVVHGKNVTNSFRRWGGAIVPPRGVLARFGVTL